MSNPANPDFVVPVYELDVAPAARLLGSNLELVRRAVNDPERHGPLAVHDALDGLDAAARDGLVRRTMVHRLRKLWQARRREMERGDTGRLGVIESSPQNDAGRANRPLAGRRNRRWRDAPRWTDAFTQYDDQGTRVAGVTDVLAIERGWSALDAAPSDPQRGLAEAEKRRLCGRANIIAPSDIDDVLAHLQEPVPRLAKLLCVGDPCGFDREVAERTRATRVCPGRLVLHRPKAPMTRPSLRCSVCDYPHYAYRGGAQRMPLGG